MTIIMRFVDANGKLEGDTKYHVSPDIPSIGDFVTTQTGNVNRRKVIDRRWVYAGSATGYVDELLVVVE